jgi:hypothetical protein
MSQKRLLTDDLARAVSLKDALMDNDHTVEQLHSDILRLTAAVNRLSTTIEPVAEHLPALIEVAHAWNTGKAVGRTARMIGAFLKWLGGVAVSLAAIYLILHSKFADVVGLTHHP